MTADIKTKAVQDFVRSHQERVETAKAVYESWPAIKNEVCGSFLEQLCAAIHQKAKEKFGEDMRAESTDSVGEGKYSNWICLYRNSWAQYKETDGRQLDRCTTICLQNQERGPNGWCIGVASPVQKEKMTQREKSRRRRLRSSSTELWGPTSEQNTWWAWRFLVEEEKNWDLLILELGKEGQDGAITNYFTGKFIEIAEKAVPIIDDIEGPGNS